MNTMNAKHTPGPWRAEQRNECGDFDILAPGQNATDGHHVATVDCPSPRIMGQIDATARLIAAAPDLLAALRDCADLLANPGIPQDRAALNRAIVAARAAIARGE